MITNKECKKPTSANLGAADELIVAANLMKSGYEVFRACGPNSKADLVARIGEDVFFIEVRQVIVNSFGELRFLAKSGDDCNFYAGVCSDGSVAYSRKGSTCVTATKSRKRKWEE